MRRIIDWKFLVALTMAAMVAYLVWVGIDASHETARKSHRIDQLIQTLQREQADSDAAQDAATAERDQLLDNQRAMLARMRSMEGELRTLRRWLAEQGIEVPADFETPPRADPKARADRTRQPPARRTAPASPEGKPRGESDDRRPPQALTPPPQAPGPPRLPSLQELLDPIL